MALIDKIFRDTDGPHISNHAFSAAVWFWATGEVTRAQVITAFGLEPSDEPQLDELAAHYASLSVAEKAMFHSNLEAAGILAEVGLISRPKYASLLGLTE